MVYEAFRGKVKGKNSLTVISVKLGDWVASLGHDCCSAAEKNGHGGGDADELHV